MRRSAVSIILFVIFAFTARSAQAQASAQIQEVETLNDGVLSIHLTCSGAGSFYNPDTGQQDYPGISIGSSTLHGCQLDDPDGQYNYYSSNGFFIGNEILNVYEPVTVSGSWDYWASFWIWNLACDSDQQDCQGYSYNDYWGYTLGNAGAPVECELNGGDCYGDYDGTYYLTNYSGLEYAYSGDSSTGAFGTFYVDALAIEVSPASGTLYGGESVTFTAEASNTANFFPIFQWTQISGPANQSGDNGAGATYTYTAPATIEQSNSTVTLRACITNLTSQPVCEPPVTIDLLVPSISVSSPSPNVLLANGTSTSFLAADLTNAAENAVVSWTPPSPTTTSTGNTTATYTAPASSATLFSNPNSNTASVGIVASVGSPAITASTSLTLVEPTTITGVSPASWTAGTVNIPVIITGTGFSAGSTVAISSPSWPMTYTCTPTASQTTIPCSVTIPANLSNMTASQGATISVSTTTSGLTSPYTYATPISIVPIAYTYSISLLTSTSSLTYGYSSTITPVITCKTSAGAACASNVSNPQLANFKLLSGLGSLTSTTNAGSTVFTDTTLIGYPAQNTTVQVCASVYTTACATTNFNIPATSITLNPPTMASPLAGGKTQAFTASIQNEGTATGLTWTLTPSPSSASSGTLTSATTTITVQGSPASGTSSNTYTAPATITIPTTVTLNACMTANLSICATPVAITLNPLPTFSVTATNDNPSQTALSLGHSMSYTVNVSALYGFTGPVVLSAQGLPTGVAASFSPSSITTSGSATMTLTSAYSQSTYIGNSTVAVTGTGGGVASSTNFALTTQPLQYKGQCGVQ